jgi:general secretion pathway protein C
MGFDAKLKRFYPLVLCALLAVVAYFQSAGIGQLIASTVAGAPSEAPVAPAAVVTPTLDGKSGQPILARNPFDSVTGPLDGSAAPEPVDGDDDDDDEPVGEATVGDPKCSFGRVMLISSTEDPNLSFAAIDDGSGKSGLRRMGDAVQGHTVQAMSWDTVWLSKGAERCKLRLGDEAEQAAAPRPTPASPARSRANDRSRTLSPELAAKITKISDTEYNVDRSMVAELLQNQQELMRSARITPSQSGVGVRLSGIRRGSLLDHLGMKNGDSLESINGFDMGDPQKALEAYGRLQTANKLTVKVNRGGSPVSIDFNIQ